MVAGSANKILLTGKNHTNYNINFFPSIGKTLEEITLSLSKQIIFLPPLIMILPQFVEIGGIIYAAPISDLIAFLIAVAFLIPELKKIPHSDEAQVTEKYKINMLNPIQNKVL